MGRVSTTGRPPVLHGSERLEQVRELVEPGSAGDQRDGLCQRVGGGAPDSSSLGRLLVHPLQEQRLLGACRDKVRRELLEKGGGGGVRPLLFLRLYGFKIFYYHS